MVNDYISSISITIYLSIICFFMYKLASSTNKSVPIKDHNKKISELQNKLDTKDKLIAELHAEKANYLNMQNYIEQLEKTIQLLSDNKTENND